MKLFFIILTYLSASCLYVKAQGKHAQFFGLNPAITVEPDYAKGEMDIGILPLVYQQSISKRADIRLGTVLNLGIRDSGNKISHVGLEACAPIFIRTKEDREKPSKGFFVAPGVGLTRNMLEEHNNLSLWAEPGYNLLITQRFALSFGLQLGATHFDYSDGTNKWGSHFGVKVIAGWWK
jgi:hypothetical protein